MHSVNKIWCTEIKKVFYCCEPRPNTAKCWIGQILQMLHLYRALKNKTSLYMVWQPGFWNYLVVSVESLLHTNCQVQQTSTSLYPCYLGPFVKDQLIISIPYFTFSKCVGEGLPVFIEIQKDVKWHPSLFCAQLILFAFPSMDPIITLIINCFNGCFFLQLLKRRTCKAS